MLRARNAGTVADDDVVHRRGDVGSTNGAENWVFDRSRSTSGSMIRLTVRRNGPPSSPLSTSTPGPIARHARVDHRPARMRDGDATACARCS